MFVISPVRDLEERNKIISELKMTEIFGSFMYSMKDKKTGALLGTSQFDICDGFGYIYDLRCATEPFDFEAMFILARQTMNFIEGCGAHICYADEAAADNAFLKAVGFNDQLFCDMTGMFDGHCGCK